MHNDVYWELVDELLMAVKRRYGTSGGCTLQPKCNSLVSQSYQPACARLHLYHGGQQTAGGSEAVPKQVGQPSRSGRPHPVTAGAVSPLERRHACKLGWHWTKSVLVLAQAFESLCPLPAAPQC